MRMKFFQELEKRAVLLNRRLHGVRLEHHHINPFANLADFARLKHG